MAKVVKKKPEPYVPHYEKGVVVVRIPAKFDPAAKRKALEWARNLAKKYSNNYSWY